MKVIELLNKIANGEEVPNRIKYEKHIYEYEEGTYILNNELEIIEEPKKIEKIDISNGISVVNVAYKLNEIIDYINKENK